jgi:hypothetical protein
MRKLLVVATLSTPFALGLFAALASSTGCTGKPAANPASSTSVSASTAMPASEAGPAMAADAMTDAPTTSLDAGDGNPWAAVLASADAADAGPPPACWKGFTATGVPEADVAELGNRCAISQGMTPLIPPVKHTFKQGESKSIPVAIVPGCYRIIAVGGKGVKDVDLALKDNAGKIAIAGGTVHKQTDLALEKMDYLVSGVVGHG